MKNIIKSICFILVFITINNCNTQIHVSDPHIDKFTGTWKWGDNVNGLTLILKRENNIQPFKTDTNTLLDSLIGFHKINKNGQTTEDSTSYFNTNFNDKKQTCVGNSDNDDSNLLVLFMSHKGKGVRLKISFIDTTHIKITEVINREGARVIYPGQNPTDWSIDIPANIILTKQ
ncbi:DUF6705 family protein [Chryseobacterium sp. Leaf394]|uniref:DUF6705 family protein n=1 Tax=Chryseobacterium sp. Leaf394 TaxID=1736361 RepID=UPI0006FD7F1D|nr:DUF6705 family protein [Chryseobacterium sp. Leaf394]KQS94315.1 hypothetical protein ASG21_18990 [Chryseobacterium sp. Leaf394]